MTTVNLYSLYCITEEKWLTVWGTEEPTTCPNNHEHTIEESSPQILDSITSFKVTVEASRESTNGNYRAQGFELFVNPGVDTVSTMDVSFPYPTSVRSTSLIVTEENIGDHLEVIAAPETVIGVVTAPVSVNDKTFNVSSTVLQYLNPGYLVELTDGATTSTLGECISIDRTNATITVENGSAHSYAPGSFIRMSVPRIRNMNLLTTGKITLGASEIGGTVNPANVVTRVIYTNKSSQPKTFNLLAELFY